MTDNQTQLNTAPNSEANADFARGILPEAVPQPQSGFSAARLPRYQIDNADRVMAWLSLVMGVLFAHFRFFAQGGISLTIYLVLTFAVLTVYFARKGYPQNGSSLVLLTAGVLCSVFYMFYGSGGFGVTYRWFNTLLLFLIVCAWICATTNSGINGAYSEYSFYDFLNVYLVRPCAVIGSLSASFKRTDKKSRLGLVLIGVVITLPLAAVLVLILAQADAAFSAVFNKIANIGDMSILDVIGRHVFGILCGVYLFWRAFASAEKNKRGIKAEGAVRFSSSLHFVPATTVYAVLGTICAVYTVYLFSQTVYFFSAFRNLLPADFSYAEYARRGFFELCAVSGINLFVLSVAFGFIKAPQPPRALRIFAGGISAFTQLLIATAIAKLMMYIREYGLTLLRVNAAWLMLVLFLLFVLVEIKCVKPSFKPFRTGAVTVAVMLMTLCWSNPERLITAYNIKCYEQGIHKTLDVDYILENLSSSALVELVDYAQSGTSRAQLVLGSVQRVELEKYEIDDWRSFNMADYKAQKVAREFWSSYTSKEQQELMSLFVSFADGKEHFASEINSFAWDELYVVDSMNSSYALGLMGTNAPERSFAPEMYAFVFMKDGECVRWLMDYPENMGFILEWFSTHKVIRNNTSTSFKLADETYSSVVCLTCTDR